MPSEPDPDWYLDHVLYYADPGRESTVRVDEVTRWEVWWRSRARDVRSNWPDLAATALTQGFVLTARQLRESRVTRAVGRGHVRRGRWSVAGRGSVALVGPTALVADGPDRWTAERRRHCLAVAGAIITNPGHVVTGNSAAVVHGLPVLELPVRPELTVPPGHTVRRSGARVAGLGPADVTSWFGVPVTSASRTVIDIARRDRRAGIVVADAALRTRRATRSSLEAAVTHAVGWPGVRQARDVIALADPLAESPLESILRLAVHDSGLPAPELQVKVLVPGRRVPYRVDMLWPEQRLIVEADGRGKYSRTEDADGDPLWAEKKREVALARLGYRVERVLWSDVVATWPATYAVLAEALGR